MNKNKKILYGILYIILVILVIYLVVYITNYYLDMYYAKKQSNLLNEISIDTNEIYLSDNEIEENNIEEIEPIQTERMLKLIELQKENDDIVAWIEIEGTNINYPVLQAQDNDYYMNRNYLKKYSSSGSIFLDKDFKWNPMSSNLLIYGHNMKNGTMFQNLLNYRNVEYYNEHPNIRFTTANEDAYYEIIAVFQSRVYYKNEKNVFRYYYFVNAENEEEYNEYVENAKKASLYDTGKSANFGDQLLTLSTCAYHTDDGRFVVVARKM